jgi:hypothetical protein
LAGTNLNLDETGDTVSGHNQQKVDQPTQKQNRSCNLKIFISMIGDISCIYRYVAW